MILPRDVMRVRSGRSQRPCCMISAVGLALARRGSTSDVADIALALILMCARDLVRANRYVHAHEWGRKPFPLATKVGGKTCGIFGLGRIGKAIAQRVAACGMRVAYHGRQAQEVSYPFVSEL